jgi:hypothetical protein
MATGGDRPAAANGGIARGSNTAYNPTLDLRFASIDNKQVEAFSCHAI